MVQVDLCLIGAGFTGGMLYTTLAKFDSEAMKEYKYSLSSDQLTIYNEIIQERSNLYVQGLLLGLVVAFLFLGKYRDTMSPGMMACTTSAIAMTVTYFYYILMPKKKSMVTFLRNKVQLDLWNKAYREMQYRYWSGFLLGLLGYGFLTYGLMETLTGFIPEPITTGLEQLAEGVGEAVEGVNEALGFEE